MPDMRFHLLSFFLLILLVVACVKPPIKEPNRKAAIEATAKAFFDTYAERTDWEKFCAFYREDLQFQDILLQLELDSLWQFKRFYNWPDTNFSKLSPEQAILEVHQLLVNDSVAIASVHFNPFYWYGQKIESPWGMEAVFELHFDENLKIKKQIDWIEYAPETLQAMLDRIALQGHEKKPDWLDLSPPE